RSKELSSSTRPLRRTGKHRSSPTDGFKRLVRIFVERIPLGQTDSPQKQQINHLKRPEHRPEFGDQIGIRNIPFKLGPHRIENLPQRAPAVQIPENLPRVSAGIKFDEGVVMMLEMDALVRVFFEGVGNDLMRAR